MARDRYSCSPSQCLFDQMATPKLVVAVPTLIAARHTQQRAVRLLVQYQRGKNYPINISQRILKSSKETTLINAPSLIPTYKLQPIFQLLRIKIPFFESPINQMEDLTFNFHYRLNKIRLCNYRAASYFTKVFESP